MAEESILFSLQESKGRWDVDTLQMEAIFGNQQLVRSALARWSEGVAPEELHQLWAAREYTQLKSAAHKLKGSFSYVCAHVSHTHSVI